MEYVIKRDGTKQKFDRVKIISAILKAQREIDGKIISEFALKKANDISKKIEKIEEQLTVEEIQDIVEKELSDNGLFETSKKYIIYRYLQTVKRSSELNKTLLEIIDSENEYWNTENSNKNPRLNTTIRDYTAGAVSNYLSRYFLLPKDIVDAHDNGIIHFHDSDYFMQHMYNCCLVNLEDMLQNGTVISGTLIEKPHSFSTACNIATQIIAQVASSQYGGQSVSLEHLAPFVDVSRQAIKKEEMESLNEDINGGLSDLVVGSDYYWKIINRRTEKRLKKEIKKGVQTIQYQITTLMTTNGQAPFITIFMYLNEAKSEQEKDDLAMLIEEVIRQSFIGVKSEEGSYVTPAFPKIIYVLEEDNVYPGSKYYYLSELCARCSIKRLTPDYISEKKMKELKEDNCFPCMGCRSFLSPWKDENGEYKFYGRFNKGVVTLNLFDLALSSGGDFEKFWNLFDERTELCHRALIKRYERLKGTTTDVAPILWENGAIARLKKGSKIDELLVGGYSSISLGYAGLYECVKYMTGESHSSEDGSAFGLEVMQKMNDKCDEWNKQLNLGYGIYGTPIESTTYKFAKKVKERFGDDVFIKLDGFDRDYITNSYHVPVFEEINAFDKLLKESKFQDLSKGGAISYVECPNLDDNIEAAIQVMQFIYETNMYAELNTKSDYCQKCGYSKEISLEKVDGKYIWICPNCGNTDVRTMDITRRTCGYKGKAENGWNQGRLDEIKNRVIHLDDKEAKE